MVGSMMTGPWALSVEVLNNDARGDGDAGMRIDATMGWGCRGEKVGLGQAGKEVGARTTVEQ